MGMRTSLLLLASALPLAACDVIETGALGRLEFLPGDCGVVGCNLGDRLAVGAVTSLEVRERGGGDVLGLELVSSDPYVFDVVGRDAFDDDEFVLSGGAPGLADVLAVDGNGEVIDYLTLEIALADDVDISIFGDAIGPFALGPATDRYEAAIGTSLSITARPAAAFGPLMGETPFDVVVDGPLFGAMTDADELDLGRAELQVPAGVNLLTFVAPGGAVRTIELIGR